MFHLDNTSAVPEMPEPKEPQSNTARWFGESQQQGGISWPGADWFNIIQAELLAILELAEETPDKTKFDQIASSIKSISDLFRKEVAQPDGTKLLGYMEVDVYQALSRLFSLGDFNKTNGYLGYNPVDDELVISKAGSSDRDLMMNGGLYLGKRLRGFRRRGTVFSVRGNQQGAGFFAPAVTGVSNSMGLRGYSSVGADMVTSYMDMNSLPFEPWEDVASATYTANSFTPDNPETWENIEVGDYIYTKHSLVCCGTVTGKNEDGSISVDMWADSGSTTTIPASGIGFYVNPENKLWVNNNNLEPIPIGIVYNDVEKR